MNSSKGALALAGFDPCGGAGVLADCKTFEFYGIRGYGVITAITAQGPQSILSIHEVPASALLDSARALKKQTSVSAIKIGMLFNASTVKAVKEACDLFQSVPIVLDPVIEASDGTRLIDDEGLALMKSLLFPIAEVITPNAIEATLLTGIKVQDTKSVFDAGQALLLAGARQVVIKGGHISGAPTDTLITADGVTEFLGKRHPGKGMHGSGCVFSSALAALLGKGKSLSEAVLTAKEHTRDMIRKTAEK